MALLAMKDMSFSYPGESQSLQCINLTIEQGEFVVLMGQSARHTQYSRDEGTNKYAA